ncbi:polyhydroxyalkanoate synthesis regulator DNA-binding domain-containing protein [Candidatus Uabimicrobium amorphum]|uniref:Pesticidal protein Cry15Aa n=1 Tax=Uabimicrobium amorphum TaxID=2596890 RepID=A0A5S9IR58_UABAM|nr:polyhydroxyalkanoate synthesis regulator DNA-binding domain-containing protein [Candidatus Uabimicrobium amorphum]BBM86116.1 pesticidal protein Cry15Aa [Candidatus Uabimicrobium amorphum]
MRLIKRYANRKLYDTIDKKYVTLENIEALIKQGESVSILDNDSNQDITTGVLSQIIAEQAKKENQFSPSLFTQIIRKGKGNMYSYASKIVQSIGETTYFIEEEVRGKVKQLVSSGEITQEEGDALQQDLTNNAPSTIEKLEKHLELLYSTVLNKLNIPEKSEVKRLRKTIDRLEAKVKEIENSYDKEGL